MLEILLIVELWIDIESLVLCGTTFDFVLTKANRSYPLLDFVFI